MKDVLRGSDTLKFVTFILAEIMHQRHEIFHAKYAKKYSIRKKGFKFMRIYTRHL
eukprot:jgi/Bigna1/64560/fgenesh1_kg.78_\